MSVGFFTYVMPLMGVHLKRRGCPIIGTIIRWFVFGVDRLAQVTDLAKAIQPLADCERLKAVWRSENTR